MYQVRTAAVAENLLKRKWSVVILRHLSKGLSDPAAICALEADLTPAAMNDRLRMMLRYGLIIRNPRRTSAKVIEYQLTPRGNELLKMLTMIEQLDDLPDKSKIVLEEPEAAPPEKPAVNGDPGQAPDPKANPQKPERRNRALA